MTKAEERKILEQIVELIQSTPTDSYIRSAFSGVPEYAVRNIEDDAAYNPVEERDMWESRFNVESREHDRDKKLLADSQKMCKEAVDENEKLRKLVAEWEQNAHDAGEMYAEENTACMKMAREIMKLKAEIVRLRMERMTEDEMATMYDRMNEED